VANKFKYLYQDPVLSCSSAAGCATTGSIHGQTASGSTPYGIYDNDQSFVTESVDVSKYVARKLGHPVMQLEFDSGSIYAMFEEAVSEYSLHINNYNIKNWMFEHYANSSKITGSGWGNISTSQNQMGTGSIQPVHPHMGTSIVLSDQYGIAVNVGGDVALKSGSITLSSSQQVYDLQDLWGSVNEGGDRLEIQRVFNYGKVAITKFYDPFAGTYDTQNMLKEFGMGNTSPGVSYILRPVSQDIVRAQAIETSDKIRKSAYSFQIVNNEMKIFPIPTSNDNGTKIWFEYYVKKDKQSTTRTYTADKVTDPSNVPYRFITYSDINAAGRQWIRKFTLASSKELLGIIRSKYASMPLPNGEVSLDGEALKAEGREEKASLMEELKEFLDVMSIEERSRAEQERAESQQQILNKAPLGIYIG